MFNLLKARLRHGYQAIPNPLKATVHQAFPGFPEIRVDADLMLLNQVCPVKAFSQEGLDLGRCIFCGACSRQHPELITFRNDFKIAAQERSHLIISPGQMQMPGISKSVSGRFSRSIALRNVSAAGCNACEMELAASNNVNFDISRYGIEIVASPRHADGLILTGPVSSNMAEALMLTWDAISEPKILVLCGSCAISGGMFADGNLDRSWLKNQPVALYIPGCPVHPLSIVQAVVSLMGRS